MKFIRITLVFQNKSSLFVIFHFNWYVFREFILSFVDVEKWEIGTLASKTVASQVFAGTNACLNVSAKFFSVERDLLASLRWFCYTSNITYSLAGFCTVVRIEKLCTTCIVKCQMKKTVLRSSSEEWRTSESLASLMRWGSAGKYQIMVFLPSIR